MKVKWLSCAGRISVLERISARSRMVNSVTPQAAKVHGDE